jgi:chromosome segregation ATPase
MMEDESSSFRLGSEPLEEAPERPAPDDSLHHIKLKKMARRSRLITLLLLGLMLLMFAWGYWDLLGRFDRQANTGNREIKNIAAVFEDRLNELDGKFATLETQLTEDVAKFDKLTVKLQTQIGALQKSMEAIDVSGTMRKEKKAMLDQVQKTFAPIKADIDNLSKDLGAFDQRIRDQMRPLEKQVSQTQESLALLQKSVKADANERLTRDDMALELLKVKKSYQQQVMTETGAVRKQVSLLTERLERLESRMRAVRTVAPSPVPAAPSGPGSKIQEQNLP